MADQEKPIFHFLKDYKSASGRSFIKHSGEIGLEIETETQTMKDYPQAILVAAGRGVEIQHLEWWKGFQDNSLRNFGMEYALRNPVLFEGELDTALTEFKNFSKNIKFIKDPVKASVHVHLNCLGETFKTIGNFLTLYALYENLLIRYSGPNRVSNMFCIPICDGEETAKNMAKFVMAAKNKNYNAMFFKEDAVKYAALNLASFWNYGSIEIRSYRGETNTDLIKIWVSILYQMMKYSRKKINPHDIILLYELDPDELYKQVFGQYTGVIYHKDKDELVFKNLWYSANIAYSMHKNDWDTMSLVPELKADFDIDILDDVSRDRFGSDYQDLNEIAQKWVIQYLNQNPPAKKNPPKPRVLQNPMAEGFDIERERMAVLQRQMRVLAEQPIPVRRNNPRV